MEDFDRKWCKPKEETYQKLDEEQQHTRKPPADATDVEAAAADSADEPQQTYAEQRRQLQMELRLVSDKVEELEIKIRAVHKKITSPAAVEARAELKELHSRRDELSHQ